MGDRFQGEQVPDLLESIFSGIGLESTWPVPRLTKDLGLTQINATIILGRHVMRTIRDIVVKPLMDFLDCLGSKLVSNKSIFFLSKVRKK